MDILSVRTMYDLRLFFVSPSVISGIISIRWQNDGHKELPMVLGRQHDMMRHSQSNRVVSCDTKIVLRLHHGTSEDSRILILERLLTV